MVLPLAKTINTIANHNLRNGSTKNGNESLYNLQGDANYTDKIMGDLVITSKF